ncbi:hypothetical protein TcasGA2_TC012594 [Tribolium castaneum]|uniref:Uncharacterized protein n=1 Tax=Tribolium castaneum TaxID=7070 RepID=D6X3E1_TRICA|nr:hypothetical protein TcasGA2_TC012594 [Tribolium castaneum]
MASITATIKNPRKLDRNTLDKHYDECTTSENENKCPVFRDFLRRKNHAKTDIRDHANGAAALPVFPISHEMFRG